MESGLLLRRPDCLCSLTFDLLSKSPSAGISFICIVLVSFIRSPGSCRRGLGLDTLFSLAALPFVPASPAPRSVSNLPGPREYGGNQAVLGAATQCSSAAVVPPVVQRMVEAPGTTEAFRKGLVNATQASSFSKNCSDASFNEFDAFACAF
jgi:hypothetical protein